MEKLSDPKRNGSLQPTHSFEEHWITLDGARMRYLRSGIGPPLLLVHGLLGYSFSWRFAIPALSEHATVYAVDMLGVGFSDRPPRLDCCLRASAERLLRFLDSAAIVSCDLLGTSHGGAVAMMAAAIAPERIRRLILVAPVNPWSPHGRFLAQFLSGPVISKVLLQAAPFRLCRFCPGDMLQAFGRRDRFLSAVRPVSEFFRVQHVRCDRRIERRIGRVRLRAKQSDYR